MGDVMGTEPAEGRVRRGKDYNIDDGFRDDGPDGCVIDDDGLDDDVINDAVDDDGLDGDDG
jgi:hypothetical protein